MVSRVTETSLYGPTDLQGDKYNCIIKFYSNTYKVHFFDHEQLNYAHRMDKDFSGSYNTIQVFRAGNTSCV